MQERPCRANLCGGDSQGLAGALEEPDDTSNPQVDLHAYQCRAVVDWVDIQFELSRRTQHWRVNVRIEKLTGRKKYSEALNLGEGRTTTQYKLRVQEPDFESVRKVLHDLEMTYGFSSPVTISGIEISVDFYPLKAREAARAQMYGVLVRHFYPTTRVLRNNRMAAIQAGNHQEHRSHSRPGEELRALNLPRIKSWHRASGIKMPATKRAGSGAYGTMIAHEELTRMVERAPAGLERKVRREIGSLV